MVDLFGHKNLKWLIGCRTELCYMTNKQDANLSLDNTRGVNFDKTIMSQSLIIIFVSFCTKYNSSYSMFTVFITCTRYNCHWLYEKPSEMYWIFKKKKNK